MTSNEDSGAMKVVQVIAAILAAAAGVWILLITWTAFFGGQAPLSPWEFTGVNLARGLLWLFILDPIVLTVVYWGFMLLMLPLIALASWIGGRKDG